MIDERDSNLNCSRRYSGDESWKDDHINTDSIQPDSAHLNLSSWRQSGANGDRCYRFRFRRGLSRMNFTVIVLWSVLKTRPCLIDSLPLSDVVRINFRLHLFEQTRTWNQHEVTLDRPTTSACFRTWCRPRKRVRQSKWNAQLSLDEFGDTELVLYKARTLTLLLSYHQCISVQLRCQPEFWSFDVIVLKSSEIYFSSFFAILFAEFTKDNYCEHLEL